jgi:nicotinamide-nucleotide amidase
MTGLSKLAKQTLEAARQKNLSIVTAESCTAGKLAALLSETLCAGECLHGGFVTYTKAHKTRALEVAAAVLKQEGAVCADVAVAMAEGALARSPAEVAVAITGVAGPDPDEDGNPVGLVCIAVARHHGSAIHLERRYGNIGRDQVCEQAMAEALSEVIRVIAMP